MNKFKSITEETSLLDSDASAISEEASYMERQERQSTPHKKMYLLKIYILFATFCTLFATTISVVVMRLTSRICKDLTAKQENGSCDVDKAKEMFAGINSLAVVIAAATGICVSGKIGELSDRYGRKMVLFYLFILFGLIRFARYLYIENRKLSFNPYVYLGLCTVEGLTGGVKAVFSIVKAYVIDIVPPEEHTASLGGVGGSMFAGIVLGPIFGVLLKQVTLVNDKDLLFIESTGYFILALCVLMFVPETHFVQKKISNKEKGGYLQLFKSLKLLWLPKDVHATKDPYSKRKTTIVLVLINALISGASMATSFIIIIYSMNKFELTTSQSSLLISYGGILKCLQGFFVVPIIVKHHNNQKLSNSELHRDLDSQGKLSRFEVFNIRLCGLSLIAQSLILIFSKSFYGVLIAIALGSYALNVIPFTNAAIIKICTGQDQLNASSKTGELFGALALLDSLSGMIIPSSVIFIYSKTVVSHIWVSFFVLTLIGIASSFCTLCLKWGKMTSSDILS